MILSAHQIGKSYQDQPVLFPFDLQVATGERLAIIGETGSGKTTLLRALAGLLDLSQGSIYYRGDRVLGPAEKLIPGHPAIAYLSQSVNLRNQYRVRDLLELNSIQDLQDDEALAKLCRIDTLLDRMTDQLSGGEKQRIGLAITLAKRPLILMLDEPFSNLDIGHRNTLRSILDELHQQLQLTVLMVSHNPSEILGWADRIMVMRSGHCIQIGTPAEVYFYPVDEYVAQLLGPFNRFESEDSTSIRLVRPEKLSLTAFGKGSRSGSILNKEFEGPTTLYWIQTGHEMVGVRSLNPDLPIGQKVDIFEP